MSVWALQCSRVARAGSWTRTKRDTSARRTSCAILASHHKATLLPPALARLGRGGFTCAFQVAATRAAAGNMGLPRVPGRKNRRRYCERLHHALASLSLTASLTNLLCHRGSDENSSPEFLEGGGFFTPKKKSLVLFFLGKKKQIVLVSHNLVPRTILARCRAPTDRPWVITVQACEHGREWGERGRRAAGSRPWRCAVRGARHPPLRVAAHGPSACARRLRGCRRPGRIMIASNGSAWLRN